MEKLSIEEKAKRYDEALEKSKILYEQGTITESLCYVFPELKESEDENIRKELIKFVKVNIPNEERYIAWLEKQGGHKPDDKAEPKFHKGEWIIHQGTENIYQVVAVIGNQYQLKYGDNYTIQYCADVDRCARLWTIQDAKAGDVLVHNGCTFIFMGIKNGIVQAIEENLLDDTNPVCFGEPDKDGDYHPATKEQCDTLMKTMANEGYTFDFEKKELKKIEQKPAWSEEDERIYQSIMDDTVQENQLDGKQIDWLRDIKYRHFSQPQNTWKPSEEQMKALEKECFAHSNYDLCRLLEDLKKLK